MDDAGGERCQEPAGGQRHRNFLPKGVRSELALSTEHIESSCLLMNRQRSEAEYAVQQFLAASDEKAAHDADTFAW